MATRNIPFPDKVRDMVLDVIKHVRRQEYTPEQLCQLQKIIECKYFYWWCMDMKKEEYVMELFTDDFRYYLNGHLAVKDKLLQARNAKWCNKDMQTMHMGHQPMIWLIDDTHARGVFQYEDHMCYYDDNEVLQGWLVYCDDFVKGGDGAWRIQKLRMAYREMDGSFRSTWYPRTGCRMNGTHQTTKQTRKPHICAASLPPHFLKSIPADAFEKLRKLQI